MIAHSPCTNLVGLLEVISQGHSGPHERLLLSEVTLCKHAICLLERLARLTFAFHSGNSSMGWSHFQHG